VRSGGGGSGSTKTRGGEPTPLCSSLPFVVELMTGRREDSRTGTPRVRKAPTRWSCKRSASRSGLMLLKQYNRVRRISGRKIARSLGLRFSGESFVLPDPDRVRDPRSPCAGGAGLACRRRPPSSRRFHRPWREPSRTGDLGRAVPTPSLRGAKARAKASVCVARFSNPNHMRRDIRTWGGLFSVSCEWPGVSVHLDRN
jgi:hypothetical protein